jgi:hypothetical protein
MQYDDDKSMKRSAGSATYSRADALRVPLTGMADHRVLATGRDRQDIGGGTG